MRLLPLLLSMALLWGTAAQAPASESTLAIVNAHVVPVGAEPFDGMVLVRNGKIAALTPKGKAPAGATVIDAKGAWLVPGFVDPHSHLAVYSFPPGDGDGNEATDPITPHARTLDAIYPEDPGFALAVAGGTTTAFIIPGSANLMGGLGTIFKTTPGGTLESRIVKFPGGLKMALGENPKRTYGGRGQMPSTRMGNAALIRQAFIDGQNYKAGWDRYEEKVFKYEREHAEWVGAGDKTKDEPQPPDPPNRNEKLEVIQQVLERKIPVHCHAHRADDMLTIIRLRDEFGFDLAAIHHATEAYLITKELKAADVPVIEFATYWGGIKLETDNMTPLNPVISYEAGLQVALHTDHGVVGTEYFRDEAALAHAQGMPWEAALRAITLTPAEILRVDNRIGSLAVGKDADLVLCSGDPLDIAESIDMVWIDGRLVFDRANGGVQYPEGYVMDPRRAFYTGAPSAWVDC